MAKQAAASAVGIELGGGADPAKAHLAREVRAAEVEDEQRAQAAQIDIDG